ncbi:MAG: hypothetical protein IPN29_19745 [Saprospiraceae bacterium]|nr:hypothetical protein [Saprospiraceae bacterium]
MAIDFFQPQCKHQTNETIFGIYDAPPSTLSFSNPNEWNLWIDNAGAKVVTHIAIDGCLNIPQSEGERCESLLTYDDVIVFLELKDSDGGRWAGKARNQLINTIALFKRDADVTIYKRQYGHIANKQRPHFKAGGKNFSQVFEDKTGFIQRVSEVLKID